MGAAVSAVQLTKRFARTSGYRDLLRFRKRQWVTAVDGVSLAVEEGELFGLLGPNGAGKSTLIKLLCSLILPNAGTALVFGHDVVKEEHSVKSLVGLVSSEERSFFWRLTGRENLVFFASLYRIPSERARKRADELLTLVGLDGQGDIRYQNYSTGMRQRLAFARGLLGEPRVLFVDEPTRSLDPISAQAIRSFLKEKLVGQGKTVVLATHNLSEAEQLCDRLAILDRGRVVAQGSAQQLRSLFKAQEGFHVSVRNLSEAILNRVRLIDGVQECSPSDNHNCLVSLMFKVSDRAEVLPQVLRVMVQGGAEVCDLRISEPSLDQVFAHAVRSAAKGRQD